MTHGQERWIGVDIGGTKVAAAVVTSSGEVLESVRAATPAAGRDAVLDTTAALIDQLRVTHTVDGIGVGAPGIVDRSSGRVVFASDILPGWMGAEVRSELEARMSLPVTVDNDVRVMAHGENMIGAGHGRSSVLFVSIGTGIGGALSIGGQLRHGAHGTAGELAHLLVPAAGAIGCGCGRTDHLEAVASGPAMAAEYAARAGVPVQPLQKVVALMHSGDPIARAVITDAGELLGRVLAGVATAFDPEVIVIGGGAAQIGADLLSPLMSAFRVEAMKPIAETAILPARLGTDAPLVGAGLLAAATRTEVSR
ncbi:ROK family protein [Rhodococcus sp. AD45-ID]|uniref:ROK family protein n=1 Tax=Rhodococcus globerulus TaxID=33008 RepID=A0ABU4C0X5_RHOGO|nr:MULTISPECIES: ROK family protein [Rhodococcus]KJF20907.1 Glucokinase [Rhodococcus sp. AD45]MDV6270033.1 ROK family protein [Rhodococcus globerulus]PSR38468.1 ROK family protein [Rhodococcus sp. AD45-ID]RZL24737.1 MAG: ROK family protein [Rhodococcus sp. (in: high G+C Gram-positive bacteria)]